MEKDRGEIARKVRKLLALGDGSRGATEAEAASAMAMARQLMTEHDLQLSDVEVKEIKNEGAVVAPSPINSHCVPWERSLATAAGLLFDCYAYRTTVGRDRRAPYSMRFIGVGQDPTIAASAYESLHETVARMGRESQFRGADQRTYMLGIACRLRDRAKDMAAAAVAEMQKSSNACRDLVLVKSAAIETKKEEIGIRPMRSGTIGGTANSYQRGYAAGGNVPLNFRQSLT